MIRTRRRLGLALVAAMVPMGAMAAAGPAALAQETRSSALSETCADPTALPVRNPGRLTLSTDIPAFPPWWGGDPAVQYPNEPESGSGW